MKTSGDLARVQFAQSASRFAEQTGDNAGASSLPPAINLSLDSIIGDIDINISSDGPVIQPAAVTPAEIDKALDDLSAAAPGNVKQQALRLGRTLKSVIAARPELKQVLVDMLAQRYRQAGAEDPSHRPRMAEVIRLAGLSEDVGTALDQLAAQYPKDANLNAQHDFGGNQTTLSAADQVRGKSLPSNLPDRNAFNDALGVLNPYLNSPANAAAHHGSFSADTVKTLSTMALDDPRWEDNTLFAQPVPVAQRQTIQNAASTVLLPKNAQLVSQVVNADGIFTDANIKTWRTNHAKQATEADGKIGTFSQGGIGDCAVLSVINAVAKSPEGRQLIEDSISHSDGVYSIQLAGDPDKTVFTVTQAEVDSALADGSASSGDADMIAFELAIEKYKNLHGQTAKDGNYPADVVKLVTGRASVTASNAEAMALIADAETDADGFTMTLACGVNADGKPVALTDPTSVGPHAFAVRSIDKTTGIATIENPWDTTKPYKMPVKDLASFGYVDYLPAPGGTTSADTARKDAHAGAKSAAQWDAEANGYAAIASDPNVPAGRRVAAAAHAHEAAVRADKASQKAQLAAGVPGAGPEAAAAAKAAAASAADARVTAAKAAKVTAADKKAAIENRNPVAGPDLAAEASVAGAAASVAGAAGAAEAAEAAGRIAADKKSAFGDSNFSVELMATA